MKAPQATMTRHCAEDRINRIEHIIAEIGLGQLVIEKWQATPADIASKGYKGKYVCITDTGITIIKSEDKLKIITMYVTTQRELVKIFGGANKVPAYLKKKVDRNQSKYIRNGKTIWS